MIDYEKLGSFYLGRVFDMASKKTKDEPLLYDSKDLVTHAVCVGMTGSGKTGLCISLIEEAAIDGIPAILIDPKGDLGNLMLTFPNLTADEFLPWINLDDARQKGLTPQAYAEKQAETWKNGLASWRQDASRIQRLREAADVLIYTPGSNAGLPVSIVNSFSVPPVVIMEDEDLFRERVNTTVTSLLGLVGVNADPMQSREHILLATIIDRAWRQGQNLDLPTIIENVQNPAITKIGVLDLESFYSAKERFGLVIALNNLLASPGFNIWLQGTPLDIGQILYTKTGKPRIAIFSISHLSDPERMFFVSLLMTQVLGWMRSQSGTTSLRALLYMDEVFGYLPPVSNPPSKTPIISLLKQARAFGLGIVLATQNPVDLDYKALTNAGTWFIGRLQTERDIARLLDGLDSTTAGSGGGSNRKQIEGTVSELSNRVFLMNNTHEDAPVVFQTRWALSYLRGPLTRDQIKLLMDPLKAGVDTSPEAGHLLTNTNMVNPSRTGKSVLPTLPPDIPVFFLPARSSSSTESRNIYTPNIFGNARVNFLNIKNKIDSFMTVTVITPVTDDPIPVIWENSLEITIPTVDLEKNPRQGSDFQELPGAASIKKNYPGWEKAFSDWLYATQKLVLFRSPGLGVISTPGESEKDFRLRLQQSAREFRDEQAESIRVKYSTKLASLKERERKALQAVEKQAEQVRHAKLQTAVSFGSTLLGAFTGRKINSTTISRASSAVRGVSRSIDEGKDVARANENITVIQAQISTLQAEFETEVEALENRIDPSNERFEELILKPNKSDILVNLVCLVWAPHSVDPQGKMAQSW